MDKRIVLVLLGFIFALIVVNYFDIDRIMDNSSNLTPTPTSTTPTPSPTLTPTPTSTTPTPSPTTGTSNFSSATIAEALARNQDNHEDEEDYTWDSSEVITITCNIDSISVDDENGNTIIEETTITMTSSGTYSIRGTLIDGQIIVDTEDKKLVRIIFNGINISSASKPPIYVANAEKTVVVLANDTENYVTDNEGNEEKGALYSRDDLTICGEGSLTVIGKSNDAIRSNDGLIIKSGTITVASVDDGIRGKDYLVIKGGEITVNSVGDGLKSDNDEDEDRGYIYIENGTITITSTKGDAITAETDLLITGGTFTLTSGGGSNVTPDDVSTKGLKAGVCIVIDDGDFSISSSDDSIHSNDKILINDGKYKITTADDGVHADTYLEINGGTFNISKSYEGMESATITINNGYIQIISSDDGINVVEKNDDSSTNRRPGRGDFAPSVHCYLYINGGFIAIDSYGDGIDSNGYIEMSDGVVIINGPTSNFNGAIDYGQGSFKITGGTLVAVGSAGMAQAPDASSSQKSVKLRFGSWQSANILVNIQTASGEDVLTFSPTKAYQSLVFSSSGLAPGSYNVYVGGSCTGTPTNGLYEDGTYSEGTNLGSFTLS